MPVTGVVDHDVKLAEVRSRLLHSAERSRSVGHIELERENSTAELLDELVQGPDLAGGRGDLVATLESGFRPTCLYSPTVP
jgi:hypothetical protein